MEVSSDTMTLEMLPARHGDALLVSWGPAEDRAHLLVDGGPASAYPEVSGRISDAVAGDGLELMVLTHIDADHIEGTLLLANDAALALDVGEFWFNGPAQLTDELGPAQGEMLAALIRARGIPHNASFAGRAVSSTDDGVLPRHELRHGLVLTVVGPDADSLRRLRDVWFSTAGEEGLVFESEDHAIEELRRRTHRILGDTYLAGEGEPDVARLAAEVAPRDNAPANRSSIVLLLEYADQRILLAGDATPTALTGAVRRLLAERGVDQLDLTAFKLPHHGSTRNITRDLLTLLPSDLYLFSSNGDKFGHPDDGGVAKCLAFGRSGAALAFNYRTPKTLRWDDQRLLSRRRQRAIYPPAGESGLAVTLPLTVPTG
ncbi:hypothetical protein [Nocardioides sp.]|uniref:hypothetical protein n=1 Tax=Nocardioides sp. TaxID=35761 RepID=UPI002ED6C165